jgi:hypothetical protein
MNLRGKTALGVKSLALGADLTHRDEIERAVAVTMAPRGDEFLAHDIGDNPR